MQIVSHLLSRVTGRMETLCTGLHRELGLSQTCTLTRSFAFLCMVCFNTVTNEWSIMAVFPPETCGVWYQTQIMHAYRLHI